MTTNELAEYCRNLKLLRDIRDSDDPIGERNAISLTERLRAGRGRVQDVYRKAKDRMEAVIEYGRTALGEQEFEEAKKEVDDLPPEPKKPVGRPKKNADQDLPGQGDMFADQAATDAREHEDARREAEKIDPSLRVNLEILRAMREAKKPGQTCEAIAKAAGCDPVDVGLRLAELEQQGKIWQDRGLWWLTELEEEDQEDPAPSARMQTQEATDAQLGADWAARMQVYAEHTREILADGPASTQGLVGALVERTKQTQLFIRDSVIPWLAGEGGVMERESERKPWRAKQGADLLEAPL